MSDDEAKRTQLMRTKLGVGVPEETAGPDLVGQIVLDRYLIEAKLGAGAMGTVYRGQHLKLARKVAIKVLHGYLGHDATMLARFRREAHVAARLRHAHVISVLDVGETPEGAQVMIMEYAEGPSLREIMRGPLPRQRIVRIVAALLRGLDHAHESGLIHRDLKPDNVILETGTDGGDVPRIVDFGIAVLRNPDDSVHGGRLTASGVIIGTPIYMAPEQAKGDEFDHRIDLFALGVMMYEMLAGKQPFSGSSMEIALANINQDAPPIANADPLLDLFARKLMARTLSARFASAHEALETLELLERDPQAAALALGRMDIAKALAMISLG